MKGRLIAAGLGSAVIALTSLAVPSAAWPDPPPLYSPHLPMPTRHDILKDDDAYAVVDALLDWVQPMASPTEVEMISARGWGWMRLPAGMPPDWAPVVQGFRDANDTFWELDAFWVPKAPFKPTTSNDLIRKMSSDRVRWPMYVSAPGFNSERTRALIYFEQFGGIDCCAGWVAFEKTGKKWEEIVPMGWSLRPGY